MLSMIFRVFAGVLGVLGALNIVLLILGEALARYSPVELRAVGTLTEALMIFGVGAGIYVLSPAGHKSHH